MINEEAFEHDHNDEHEEEENEDQGDGSTWEEKYNDLKKIAFIPIVVPIIIQKEKEKNKGKDKNDSKDKEDKENTQEGEKHDKESITHTHTITHKIGGVPFSSQKHPHPICQVCLRPITFFLQLRLDHLPQEKKIIEAKVTQQSTHQNTPSETKQTETSTETETIQTQTSTSTSTSTDTSSSSFSPSSSSSSIPNNAGDKSPSDSGLIQLFYCTDNECENEAEAFFPFAKSVVVRYIPLGDLIEEPPIPLEKSPHMVFPEKEIQSWKEVIDYPTPEEGYSLYGVDLTAREQENLYEKDYPRPNSKLGGYPFWIQGVEYPHCRICSKQMVHIFQLTSEELIPYVFGDLGTGHITRCPEHFAQLAFGWACG